MAAKDRRNCKRVLRKLASAAKRSAVYRVLHHAETMRCRVTRDMFPQMDNLLWTRIRSKIVEPVSLRSIGSHIHSHIISPS